MDLYRVMAQRKDRFSRARNVEPAETRDTWPTRIRDTRRTEIYRTEPMVSFYRPSIWHGCNPGLKFKLSPYLDSFRMHVRSEKHMVEKLYYCYRPREKASRQHPLSIVTFSFPIWLVSQSTIVQSSRKNRRNIFGYKWQDIPKFFGFAINPRY